MSELITNLLATIGGVLIAGGVVTTAAFYLFRLFGEKWLSARFDQQLASFKHAQQKEIEELRYKINALLDRAVKLHQREFDILPEAWSRLNDSYGMALSVISPIQSYPDFDRMTANQLDSFLESSPLVKWEQDELRNETKKSDYYINRISWHRVSDAKQTARETHIYLRKNGIFIMPTIKQRFDEIDQLVWDVLVEYEANLTMNQRPRQSKQNEALRKNGEGLLKSLGEQVQGRLWNAESVDSSIS
jgi:hypothetical protein